MKLRAFLDRYALIISMVLGVVGYQWFRHLSALTSPLIFLMLFFTFCKINPLDLRLRLWHWLVLAVQLLLSVVVYFAIHTCLSSTTLHAAVIAQGIMLCIIMPTATAAPIIAGKLGGSIQNLTTFSLLSNIATAIVVPAFFPIVNPSADISFLPAMWLILRRVAPLLLGPFLSAWAVRYIYELYWRRRGEQRSFRLSTTWASMPFYLWILLLIVLMGKLTHTLITQHYSPWVLTILCVGALLCCILQFILGRMIGYRFPASGHGQDYCDILINPRAAEYTIQQKSRITAGQAFGQKNTALGIWMAQMYLHPLASIAPAAYIIWQNLFNSYQLWQAGRQK